MITVKELMDELDKYPEGCLLNICVYGIVDSENPEFEVVEVGRTNRGRIEIRLVEIK